MWKTALLCLTEVCFSTWFSTPKVCDALGNEVAGQVRLSDKLGRINSIKTYRNRFFPREIENGKSAYYHRAFRR